MVPFFRYLGRTLTAVDNDWPSVVTKLQNAHMLWAQLLRIPGREGEDARTSGCFYITADQANLIFGLDI